MVPGVQYGDIFGNMLFENGPVVIFLWNNDSSWSVENVTQNVANMLGYGADELKSGNISYINLLHPQDMARVQSEVSSASKSNIYTFKHEPYRVTAKNGDIKWLLDNTCILRDANNKITHYLGYLVDITERMENEKHAESELNSALSRFRDIFNISQVGLALLSPDGKIIEVNDKALEMFRLQRDNTIKQDYATKLVKAIKPDGTLMMPDDYAGMRALKEKRAVHNIEFGMDYEGENTTWILANAVPLDEGKRGVIVSYTDITYKKELEDALKKVNENLNALVDEELGKRLNTELKLQKIFKSISVGVTIVDGDGSYIDFNDAYMQIYGYERDELQGKQFWLVVQDHELEYVKKHHYEFMNSELEHERFYFQAKRRDGKLIDIFGTSSKIIIDDKQYKITTIMDVTEQKQQEKMLIDQSRLAEMGEMIGVIAHQWRQPLNAIAIIIQDVKVALEYGEISNELIEKSVKDSMDILNFMSKTIDDFRGFFRKDKEKTTFDACESISDVIRLIKPQLIANEIEIDIEPECKQIYVHGYQNEFKQAMLNIITNAKDAIIEKREGNQNIIGNVQISTKLEQKTALITIKDNGTGIKMEHMSKIFEPYFSTKSISGTGIGLYMTKTIIEKNMNGKISAANWQEGAAITISLPGSNDKLYLPS